MIIDVADPISLKQFEEIQNKEPVMIWYHAEWCGHCQHMADEWEQFTNHCKSKNMNTAKNLLIIKEIVILFVFI